MAKKSKKQSDTKKEQKTENTKKTKKKQSDTRKTIHINALQSFDAIMTVVNRHRPYEPSDFVKEYYLPDFVIALLIATNFAIGTPNGNLPAKMNTKVKTEERVLTELYQNIQKNNQAMVFGNSKVHKL